MNKISIIIPILNEADIIADLIQYLINNSSKNNIAEIIVVDGGSTDGSQKIISTLNNVELLNSERGRAKQMNLGSKHTTGNILYFLHADSFPPENFDQFIINEIEKGNNAGCFKMRFESNHWWLRLAGWLTKFNWRACRGGDQSLFITQNLFKKLGGYNETFTIYEDIDLINKLYKQETFIVLQHSLTTSARRYDKIGVWKLQYHFWTIYVKKWFGASAKNLQRYYLKHID